MNYSEHYLIQWNPFPGNFWVSRNRATLAPDQAEHFTNRGLAFADYDTAVNQAALLNQMLMPLIGEHNG